MTAVQKVLDIQKNLIVEKTGYDENNDYYYFKADDVVNAVKREMNRVGLVHRVELLSHNEETKWDNNGRARIRTALHAKVIFIDPEDNTEFPTEVSATGSDIGGDKSTRKAHVQAFKIACLDTFKVTEGGAAFDSDGAKEQEPMDMTPAAVEEEGKATLSTIRKEIGALVNDKEIPVDSAVVNTVGARIAKAAGISEDNKIWQKDINVMRDVIIALKAGEIE